ncbi:hypothetical protein PHMEG_0007557 [Phytophthora megakarya]|uniref:Chromo domain-containing protein n=1 Tax=Phytophthora megakarya TaxID=4795 RepID=A0A225WM67_9STRA|nr:hypothetical protein PHMEG_0007557 [Phytophthora megakarya]
MTLTRLNYDKQQSSSLAWRQETIRQQEIALKMAKEYQVAEKTRRAQEHNESLSRVEKAVIPRTDQTVAPGDESAETRAVTEDSNETSVGEVKSLIKAGDRVWLYMERVKHGLTKILGHLWHGPFRVKEKVQEFAYEHDLPDRSDEFDDGPNTLLAAEVTDASQLDFDEELLPEDSWEPDHVAGEYEVEAILDDRVPMSTSTERAVREVKVKWMSYEEPTWEPASNLSCGSLLYDYLCEKRRDRRLQMVQVADED